MPIVALATCARLPEADLDEELLVGALRQRGVEARVVPWDGDRAAFHEADLVVVRSTWNYHLVLKDFLGWVDDTAPKLLNPAHVIRWNAHKRYLADLAGEGFATVPTVWGARGQRVPVGELGARGWRDVVVKPAVSGGSHETYRLKSPFDEALMGGLAQRFDLMIQPYMASVDDHGERAVICIEGAVTHAVRKAPRFSGQPENVSEGAVPVAGDERELATRLLRRFSEPPLYARLDVVRGARGEPLIGELELIEPSLFLRQSPDALARFADAILRRLGQERARSGDPGKTIEPAT